MEGKIRGVQRKYGDIQILTATECDILPDGALDYPDGVLAELDLVISAVHSAFKRSKREMTGRICRALLMWTPRARGARWVATKYFFG